jgi:Tol biopolymer transport system component
LAIGRLDGTVLREFPTVVEPDVMCFSRDGARLVTDASYEHKAQLVLVDLKTRAINPLSERGYLTSQCWSGDDTEFVYWGESGVRIYNLARRASRELVKGYFPSWSPDSKWIGFLAKERFFAIAPDGTGQHLLFKPKDKPNSGVWWSPDGRFVAYSQRGGSLGRPCHWWSICVIKFEGPYQLRVRRLSDRADEALFDEGDTPVTPNYQWVLPKTQNR